MLRIVPGEDANERFAVTAMPSAIAARRRAPRLLRPGAQTVQVRLGDSLMGEADGELGAAGLECTLR